MSRISLLLLVAVCAVALRKVHAETDEEKEIHETLVPIIAECSKEHGAKVEEVMASKKNKDYEAIDGCLIECVYKKMGMMDDNGAFVVEKLVENAKKFLKDAETQKIEEVVKHCTEESEKSPEDKCGKSKMLLACMMEQKEAVIL
ncbi:pheromone-binding protein Gp-9-like isoform X2 [Leguminivora glycinivorella]|uniref:pheromone-binding protein Gp-9-like isoform X2 n=1 Tax=Leguminivora glycinivorella TaxID=1035111 RepID=UPI00200F8F63|nr:pheromone-binding protein Gp-9-like isoform X2 [Leguminivora glycinivorella]